MKKLLFTILMMLPMLANAYDIKIGDIYYNYINNGKEVIDVMVKGFFTEDPSYTLESVYNNAPR